MQWVQCIRFFIKLAFSVCIYVAAYRNLIFYHKMTNILFIVLLASLLSSCCDATGIYVYVCNYGVALISGTNTLFQQQLYWSHHLIRHVLETQSPTHVSLILDSWCGVRIIKLKYSLA